MSPYRVAARVFGEARDPTSVWRPMAGMLLVGFVVGLSVAVSAGVWGTSNPPTACRDEAHRLAFIAWSKASCSHPGHRSVVKDDLLVCTCGRTP